MDTAEQLINQLESLEDLRSIVKTMKALSAVSIRQYEKAAEAVDGYYNTIELGLYVALKDSSGNPEYLTSRDKEGRLAAIVFGTDHGLCGRFNEEIAAHAVERMDSTPTDPEARLILAVGSRVAASLEQEGQNVIQTLLTPSSAPQIATTVQRLLPKIDEWREQHGVHYVYIFYNRHYGVSGYRPVGIELLPINMHRFHRLQEIGWQSRSLPIFTMDRQKLLSRLLRQYLFVSIFRGCAESLAGEHSSRLSAMQSAERNLDERLEEVTMDYRHARQNAITAELLDITAGFEVARGNED